MEGYDEGKRIKIFTAKHGANLCAKRYPYRRHRAVHY